MLDLELAPGAEIMVYVLATALSLAMLGGNESPERRMEYSPAVGSPQIVSPGTTMLEARVTSITQFEKAKTVGDFADAFGLVRTRMTVPDGTTLVKTARGFCTSAPIYAFVPVCFLGSNAGSFDRWQLAIGGGSYRLHKPLYYQALGIAEGREPTGAVYAITYLGVSGGTIRVSYREFSDGLARPAFTEDLTFDKPNKFPATIALKGYKIAIDGVDNSGLAYRVLSNP